MNTNELRKKIAELETANWFNGVEVSIDYPACGFSKTLKGFSSIHKFLSQQIEGWETYGNDVPNELRGSKIHFNNLKTRIENFLEAHKNAPESHLGNPWRNELGQFKSNSNFFIYDSPQTEFLIEIQKDFPKSFQGAYNFIIGSHNINNYDNFIGAMLAYEFSFKDHTGIPERRKKEKSSISKIRNDLRSQLSEAETQLSEHLTNSNKEYANYVKAIDEIKIERKKLFDTWFGQSKNEFADFDKNSKDKIKDLETTYEELLRLKKPAEYWKLRATQLKKEGWISIYWLIGLVAFACLSLYLLLWLTPEGMLLSFKTNQSGAIKWSVIYITFLSFLAFGIRALNKVAFSSFHLARDAEEREQLTYVYLSLIKDSAVDEKEKNLIMQSLFSRADTGLLKEDSSPTMPNDIAGKIFGK